MKNLLIGVMRNGKIVWKKGPYCWYFCLNLKYLGGRTKRTSKQWKIVAFVRNWLVNVTLKMNLSWHWRLIQTFKKNWPFVWKMTWGIWWSLIRAVERLKICTLMSYFCRKYVTFGLKKNTEEMWCEKWLIASKML